MPSATKHLRRAQAHLDVAEKLATDPDALGWAAVILFYSARDLAHAVFDADPGLSAVCKHPTSHTNQDLANPGTNAVIKRHFRSIETDYVDLYSVSKGVRYEGLRLSQNVYDGLMVDFAYVRAWAIDQLRTCDRIVPDWLENQVP